MKRILLIFTVMLMSIGMASAEEGIYTGLIITTPDGTTSYALSDMPTIIYSVEGDVKYAKIYVNGSTEPSAVIELKENTALSAVYSTYIPTGINGVASSADKAVFFEKNGRKYISGGKLIVIGKDGKQYDVSGKLIQ